MEDGGGWAGANFFGLDDLGALCQFPGSSNYLLKGFDSYDESYDPSRECFMCDGELREGVSDENEGEHTLAEPAACIMEHAGGAAMPPPMGQP
jgi:hypothetical protein